MSILEYNGGCVVAMVGKNCVAIASDKRYGIRQQTVGTNMQKVFQINDKCFLGMSGLATDVQTVYVCVCLCVCVREMKILFVSFLVHNQID